MGETNSQPSSNLQNATSIVQDIKKSWMIDHMSKVIHDQNFLLNRGKNNKQQRDAMIANYREKNEKLMKKFGFTDEEIKEINSFVGKLTKSAKYIDPNIEINNPITLSQI